MVSLRVELRWAACWCYYIHFYTCHWLKSCSSIKVTLWIRSSWTYPLGGVVHNLPQEVYGRDLFICYPLNQNNATPVHVLVNSFHKLTFSLLLKAFFFILVVTHYQSQRYFTIAEHTYWAELSQLFYLVRKWIDTKYHDSTTTYDIEAMKDNLMWEILIRDYVPLFKTKSISNLSLMVFILYFSFSITLRNMEIHIEKKICLHVVWGILLENGNDKFHELCDISLYLVIFFTLE